MKFFTLESYFAWHEFHDRKTLYAIFDDYKQHLQNMQGLLPDNVITLAELPGVSDGLVVRINHERDIQYLKLTLRCGDSEMGYYDLVLEYLDAFVLPEHDQLLAWIARGTKGHRDYACDLNRHEVDQAEGGRIEHRFLFNPGICFTIQCRELRWVQIEKRDRRIPTLRDRYPGGPEAIEPEDFYVAMSKVWKPIFPP